MRVRLSSCILIMLLVIVIDRLSKLWAISHCRQPYALMPGISCELLFNSGISWGMLQARTSMAWVLLSLGLAFVIAALCVHAYYRYKAGNSLLGEAFVVAGALGNMIDRIYYRAVIDFIGIGWGTLHFPTLFNLADVAIVIGALIMLASTCFENA